jgi:hypothetical protein
MSRKLSVTALICLTWWAGSQKAILIFGGQADNSSSRTAPTAATKGNTKELKFKPILMGELRTDYGAHLGVDNFVASDGVGLTVRYNATSGSVSSDSVFEHEIARAAKVISREPLKNSAGKVLGERAEILFHESNHEFHAVLWTWNGSFHEIESSSLRHVLAMEKSYRPY